MMPRHRRDCPSEHDAIAQSGKLAASPLAGPRLALLSAINLALLGVLLYIPSLRTPFVYDDLSEVARNPSIRDLHAGLDILRAYPTRPLTNLSYALDAAWSGANPFGYHLTNLLLHGINIALVFAFIRALIRRTGATTAARGGAALGIPLVAASLFAVHPLQTESVTYISGRAEVLSSAFFLGAIICAVRALSAPGHDRAPWIIATAAAFVGALGSKEVALVFPVILLACDWMVLGRDPARKRRILYVYLPLCGVLLASGAVRSWRYLALEQSASAGLQWRNALLELHVLQRYIALLFVPRSLSIVPAVAPLSSLLDIRIAMGAATLLACAAVAAAMRRREPLITFGIIWFLVTLIPSAAIVVLQSGGHAMAEHRLYLPSIGFFIVVAVVANRVLFWGAVPRRRLVLAAVAWIALVAVFSAATLARERMWADPVTLWSDAASKAPDEFIAQYGLADAYRTSNDCASAIRTYQRASLIRPAASAPYIGIAACLAEQGRGELARQQLEVAVVRAPNDVNARVALAVLEARTFGNAARAADLCRSAMALDPRNQDAINCAKRTVQALSLPLPR